MGAPSPPPSSSRRVFDVCRQGHELAVPVARRSHSGRGCHRAVARTGDRNAAQTARRPARALWRSASDGGSQYPGARQLVPALSFPASRRNHLYVLLRPDGASRKVKTLPPGASHWSPICGHGSGRGRRDPRRPRRSCLTGGLPRLSPRGSRRGTRPCRIRRAPRFGVSRLRSSPLSGRSRSDGRLRGPRRRAWRQPRGHTDLEDHVIRLDVQLLGDRSQSLAHKLHHAGARGPCSSAGDEGAAPPPIPVADMMLGGRTVATITPTDTSLRSGQPWSLLGQAVVSKKQPTGVDADFSGPSPRQRSLIRQSECVLAPGLGTSWRI